MEAESLELEDGEVIDDEASDIETYKVLKRPHAVVSAKEEQATSRVCYVEESDDSVDTESDSDSDSKHMMSKRPKLKLKRSSKSRENKNDKYKIWCAQVQEDSLTEDLVLCGVTKKRFQERNVENYNIPYHYSANGSWDMEQRNNNSSEEEKDNERRYVNKRKNSDRGNVKLRLGRKRKSSMDVDNQKGAVRKISDLSITADSADIDVATDIMVKLNEKKNTSLISRIVSVIGKEKAIDFFQETRKIEEDGGMLIMNGSRRRTAGGVYFWLIKNDQHIPQEKIREIFFYKEKTADANARRQKAQELIKCLENGSEKDLPALLTRAELSTKEIAEEARLRRGEGMERMPVDSDRTVTNPPPSPVTDDPDHSEHQEDREDFLDIGIDVDIREVF